MSGEQRPYDLRGSSFDQMYQQWVAFAKKRWTTEDVVKMQEINDAIRAMVDSAGLDRTTAGIGIALAILSGMEKAGALELMARPG